RVRVCLTDYLARFDRSIDLLANPSADMLGRAPDLLARLSPPAGDYCADTPDRSVDPDLARNARAARDAAVLGEFGRGHQLADAAIEATRVDGDRHTLGRAE